MQIIIDTSNQDLFVALIAKNRVLKYQHIANIAQKADNLPRVFDQVLAPHAITEIAAFYITIGPGSFTGARVGLVFARTIAQITKAALYTTTSLQFKAGPTGKHEIYIDARSKLSYYAQVVAGQITSPIQLVPFQTDTRTNYQTLLNHVGAYLNMFERVQNLLAVHPVYIKKPRIGG